MFKDQVVIRVLAYKSAKDRDGNREGALVGEAQESHRLTFLIFWALHGRRPQMYLEYFHEDKPLGHMAKAYKLLGNSSHMRELEGFDFDYDVHA